MGKYQCVAVDLAYYENEKTITVLVDDEEDEIKISTEIDGIELKSIGEYYFETFQNLRDQLLDIGYGIKCNGSRINAVQSNMMGVCDKVYLVENGKPALMKDVVRIWDYADIDFFPNTKEQTAFFTQWINK